MPNTIANRQIICDVLMETAKTDKDITVLCSDSRGSASLTPFANAYPQQFVEVGIAEQDLVSISAGLAACGKRPFAASPACFLSTRSMEQVRVDVAYSHTNVKLIGISGGVSYGALGLTHHSAQDIAIMGSIPNLRVYLPSDRFQTRKLMEQLVRDTEPAYLRVGRNPTADVYAGDHIPFVMDRATTVCEGGDITIIACGEMVSVPRRPRSFCTHRASAAACWICTASNRWIPKPCWPPRARPGTSSRWRNTASSAAWVRWSARSRRRQRPARCAAWPCRTPCRWRATHSRCLPTTAWKKRTWPAYAASCWPPVEKGGSP